MKLKLATPPSGDSRSSAQFRTHAVSTMSVHACEIPVPSFLRKYKDGTGHADCYVTEVPGLITQPQFVEAFYTSPLFKIERTIISCLASKPATDSDAKQLAAGNASKFSAWSVEAQSPSELLLADFTGRTRSWLMALPCVGSPVATRTRLYFGSAVVARTVRGSPQPNMGWAFHSLLGFHRVYSRLLLSTASGRVGSD